MRNHNGPQAIGLAILLSISFAGCSKNVELKAIQVAPTTVEATVSTTSAGTVEAEGQAVLNFSATGRIAKILVKAGQVVKKGQILAELENTDLQTIYLNAAQELSRSEELLSNGLVSKAAYDEAKKNRDISQANLDRSRIKAPFDGVVSDINLELGELAQAAATAAKPPIMLIDQKPRIIKGQIDEVDLSKVKVGAPARVKIQAVGQNSFSANVTRVVPYVNSSKEQDRVSIIELKLVENKELIPVGASADIEIITDTREKVLAIPTRLILGRGDARHVFAFKEGVLKKTLIQAGIGNYDKTEIRSGLSAGDTVVYPPDDAEIKDGSKVKVKIQPWP